MERSFPRLEDAAGWMECPSTRLMGAEYNGQLNRDEVLHWWQHVVHRDNTTVTPRPNQLKRAPGWDTLRGTSPALQKRGTMDRTSEFVAYGLPKSFAGPRVLERESWTSMMRKEIALGHGLRWTGEPWIEVGTFQPNSRNALSTSDNLAKSVSTRLEGEVEDLAGRLVSGIRGQRFVEEPPMRITIDGVPIDVVTRRCGPLAAAGFHTVENALVIVATCEVRPIIPIDLTHICDLEPYRSGIETDLPRRGA
jgi:hypothetical protein